MNSRAAHLSSLSNHCPRQPSWRRMLAAAAVAWATVHSGAQAQDPQVVIGASLPLHGTPSAYGRELADGAHVPGSHARRLTLKPSAVLKLGPAGVFTAGALATLVKAAPPAVILIAPQARAAQFMLQFRATSLRPTVTAVSESPAEVLLEKIGAAARGVGLQVMPHPWIANLPVTRAPARRP